MRRILRKSEVARLTGQCARTIDRLEALGQFPQRITISANAVGWYDDEVEAWIDSRPRGGVPAPEKAINARLAKSA